MKNFAHSPMTFYQKLKLSSFFRRLIAPCHHSSLHIQPYRWMLLDAIIAILSLLLPPTPLIRLESITHSAWHILIFPICAVLAGNIVGLYDRDILIKSIKLFITAILTTFLSIACFSLFATFIFNTQINRFTLTYTGFLFFLLASGWRFLYYLSANYLKINVLLIGHPDQSKILTELCQTQNSHYSFIGFCGEKQSANMQLLGNLQDIANICHQHTIQLAVITDEYVNNPHILDKCFETAKTGCQFVDEETFFEQVFEQVLIEKIDPRWFFNAKLGIKSSLQSGFKRAIDIFFAVIGLTISALLFPLIGIAIKLSSQGPIFYSQIRSGQFGHAFKIYKFRTMVQNAEKNGAQWATKSDDRVTNIGKFLRKTRLDELPQFWNILIGDMSFVGPRPERPELVAIIENQVPYFYFRHWIKPGITGLAQIRYRYGSNMEDAKKKLKYDLYYMKNWSLLMDVQIILRTISTMMKGAC